MSDILRWFRGALGTGVTWAAAWAVVGLVLFAGFSVFRTGDIGNDGLGRVVGTLSIVGFLSGVGFAVLLTVTMRRRSLRDLSLPGVAGLGALGSAAIPFLLGADPSVGWITGTLGAVFAATSVAVARRAELPKAQPPELLE